MKGLLSLIVVCCLLACVSTAEAGHGNRGNQFRGAGNCGNFGAGGCNQNFGFNGYGNNALARAIARQNQQAYLNQLARQQFAANQFYGNNFGGNFGNNFGAGVVPQININSNNVNQRRGFRLFGF